jgi:hypothetical protein
MRVRGALGCALAFVAGDAIGADPRPEARVARCPRVEWDFDNGRRSSHEEDCEPFAETSRIERRFLVRHSFTRPGTYWVAISLWRADREVARAATSLYITASSSDGSGPFAAANR